MYISTEQSNEACKAIGFDPANLKRGKIATPTDGAKCLLYNPRAGTRIEDAAGEAVLLADFTKGLVQFTFNDVVVTVLPGLKSEQVTSYWRDKFDLMCAEHRKTPEYRARQAESEQRKQEAQVKTDELLAELPSIVADEDKLLKWMVDLSSAADQIGVRYDLGPATAAIKAQGHKASQYTNLPESEYDKKEVMRRYIIGQGLSFIEGGSGPHPMIESFYQKYLALT